MLEWFAAKISPFFFFILVFDSFFLDVAIALDPLLLEIFVVIVIHVFTLVAALWVTFVAAQKVTLLAALAAAWRALQAKVEDEEERETEKPEEGWFQNAICLNMWKSYEKQIQEFFDLISKLRGSKHLTVDALKINIHYSSTKFQP